MTYEFKGGSPRKMTIGIVAILAIILFLSLFYFAPFAENAPDEQPVPPPSTEWTTAPEEPGVAVDLPDTPMTNVPAEAETEKKEAE